MVCWLVDSIKIKWFSQYKASSVKSNKYGIFVVQLLSHVWFFVNLWTTAWENSLSFTISWSMLKLMSIESVMPSQNLFLYCPLLLMPSVHPSIRVFSNEPGLSASGGPNYWSLNFNISPSNKYSGLYNVLIVPGTLKSLLQIHSSKAWILCFSAFFMVHLSHLYMTTGKTIALTRWNVVGKVMSLLFKMLSRFIIAFLPRSKRLLISWL